MKSQFAKQRIIKDVRNDDIRIQITGYIKEIVESDYFILDDKTGEIKVDIKNFDLNFKNDNLINVIGDLMLGMNGEKSIVPDIIQDMDNLNFNYYRKLYELKKELEFME